MEAKYAWHPERLDHAEPILLEEMGALKAAGKHDAVTTMIGLCADLRAHGRTSRYLTKLEHWPVWELKPRSRDGVKGGCRIYLFLADDGSGQEIAVLVNCEVKDADDRTDPAKLKVCLQVMKAYQAGVRVFKEA